MIVGDRGMLRQVAVLTDSFCALCRKAGKSRVDYNKKATLFIHEWTRGELQPCFRVAIFS